MREPQFLEPSLLETAHLFCQHEETYNRIPLASKQVRNDRAGDHSSPSLSHRTPDVLIRDLMTTLRADHCRDVLLPPAIR